MKRILLAGLGGVLLVIGLSVMGAQAALHSFTIDTECAGPDGPGNPVHVGDVITCTLTPINLDSFGHSIQINSIINCVHHASGDICTGNLLGAPLVLVGLGEFTEVTHTDVVQAGDGPSLTNTATIAAIDLGTESPMSATVVGTVHVVCQ